MKIEYIKANGVYFRPQEPGIKDKLKIEGNYPVCKITELESDKWKIEYFDIDAQFSDKGSYSYGDENHPNVMLILFPSGIEEIRYKITNNA